MIRLTALAAVLILAGWTDGAYSAVAVADRGRLWLDRVVPFAICEAAEGRTSRGCDQDGMALAGAEAAKVRDAVAQWNGMFGDRLRFVPVDSLPRSRRGVLFSQSNRDTICSTDRIGRPRTARRTNVTLGARCNGFAGVDTPVGTILHEMMHVAGFYHEQQRPDRDAFIRARVPSGLVSVLFDIGGATQWVKAGRKRMRLLGPYDFRSIMHYPIRNPKKAELTLEGRQRLEEQGLRLTDPGRRDTMSPGDIAAIRLLYGPGAPPEAFAMTEREAP